MERTTVSMLGALLVAAALVPLPSAAAAGDTERYGSLATGMPYDREIRLGSEPTRIAVWRLETIRFVAADGREFTWRFDGLRAMDEFPLERIAPAQFSVPAGASISLNGEIPVSGP